MTDAVKRGRHGAIWTANGSYSFVNSDNTQTNATINTNLVLGTTTMVVLNNACLGILIPKDLLQQVLTLIIRGGER
jgi:hypothetical protein